MVTQCQVINPKGRYLGTTKWTQQLVFIYLFIYKTITTKKKKDINLEWGNGKYDEQERERDGVAAWVCIDEVIMKVQHLVVSP